MDDFRDLNKTSSTVPYITIGVAVVLIALGPVGWFGAEEGKQSPTAFIPSVFGVVLAVLGCLALRDNMRKHAMHTAVLVGLLGLVAAAARALPVGLSGDIKNPLAFGMQVAMAVTCAVFVGLCVKSFIDARRRRQSQAQ